MKMYLVCVALTLIAAGCNNTSPTSSLAAVPKGAGQGYQAVLDAVRRQCGNSVGVAYFYSQRNPYLNGDWVDSYEFTAGTCGSNDQLIGVLYERATNVVAVDAKPKDNPSGLLQPFPVTDWNINSNQAIATAMISGGQGFLRSHPGGDISIVGLSNRRNQPFRFEILFKSVDGSNKLIFYVDPKTGALVQ